MLALVVLVLVVLLLLATRAGHPLDLSLAVLASEQENKERRFMPRLNCYVTMTAPDISPGSFAYR